MGLMMGLSVFTGEAPGDAIEPPGDAPRLKLG